jgi:outer membrane receptor protein involved in Fe transport
VIGGVSWRLGDFGVSTTTTYIPSYQDADLLQGPLHRRISSQTTVDLQTWLDLEADGWLDRARLTLGARNLSNETAEFAHAGGSLGYDFSQAELTGRFLYMRVSKRF